MYKYDKENDRIIDMASNGCYGIVKSYKELEALREALGLKKHGEQKYTVQILINDNHGFLNVNKTDNNNCSLSDSNWDPIYQAQFTQKEIDKLKRNPDLAIDWNKAIISPVEN